MVMNTLNVELPEGFKMTELGPLPKEWEVVEFEQCINKGHTRVGKVKQQEYKECGKYPVIDQGQSLIAGYWDGEKDVYQGKLPVIIFGDHTRNIKYVNFPFVAGADGVKVLVPNTLTIYPMFFYFALINLKIPNRGYNRHYSLLRESRIPLPPLSEQQKIAAVLSSIQEAKEKTEAVISAAKGLKKSMMKYLFTYGPVPVTDAENVPLKETEIGIVPEEWEVIGIKEVIDLRRGVSWRKAEANKEGIGIPVIGIPNIKEDGSIDFANTYFLNKNVKKEKLLQEGDILFVGSSGSIRHVGRNLLIRELPENTFTYASFTFLGRVKQGKAISKFIYYLLNSSHVNFEKYARRASDGKYNFQLTQFKNEQKLPLPPLPEQQKIAFILSAIDEKIEAEESKKQALEDLFRSMLHNLMTAKIRVNNLKIDIDEEL